MSARYDTVGTWMLVAALVVAAALACGDTSPRSSDKVALGVYVQRSWSLAREAPGHRVHVVHHHIRCAKCHDLASDAIDPPGPEPCRQCHEKESTIVHDVEAARAAFGPDATAVCTECHGFGEAHGNGAGAPGPWDCPRCHTPHAETGAVIVHRDEDCGACHAPHETPRTAPSRCTECHKEIHTAHASRGKGPAEVCTTCHENLHGPAAPARDTCRPCHAEQEPRIPETALFPEGHTECTGCHRPHDYEASQALDCRSCHSRVRVMAPAIAEHARCGSCHDAHDVRKDPSSACAACHADQKTDHPKAGAAGVCTGCHDPHPPGARATGPRACSSCHQGAASDHAFHAGGIECTSCHAPHHFALDGASRSFCKRCHEKQVSLTATPAAGHARCDGCHTGLPHQAAARRVACGSCHLGPAREVRQGHDECRACHEPHSGALSEPCRSCHQTEHRTAPEGHRRCTDCHTPHSARQTQTCAGCHGRQAKDVHARRVEGGCASCHRAHGPKGVARPPACRSCHDAPLPALHTVTKHDRCVQCHSVHELRLTPERPICMSCHTEKADHFPEAERCSGCHLFRAP